MAGIHGYNFMWIQIQIQMKPIKICFTWYWMRLSCIKRDRRASTILVLSMLPKTPSVHSTFKGQHPHVHPWQFAVGDLQLLQRVREAGGEGVVLLRDDGELLLGLLDVSGAHGSERGQGKAARVTSSVCQTSGREEVLQAVGISLGKSKVTGRLIGDRNSRLKVSAQGMYDRIPWNI